MVENVAILSSDAVCPNKVLSLGGHIQTRPFWWKMARIAPRVMHFQPPKHDPFGPRCMNCSSRCACRVPSRQVGVRPGGRGPVHASDGGIGDYRGAWANGCRHGQPLVPGPVHNASVAAAENPRVDRLSDFLQYSASRQHLLHDCRRRPAVVRRVRVRGPVL